MACAGGSSAASAFRSCTVYCGARHGSRASFSDAAAAMGKSLGRARIHTTYGGGTVGLMGVLARAVLDEGGEVTGIIPHFLAGEKESTLTALEVVDTMEERRSRLYNKSQSIIVLPGGIGTFEEAFEVLGWITQAVPEQRKPMGFLNVGGFFEPLLEMIRGAVHQGFVREGALHGIFVDEHPELLLEKMLEFAAANGLQAAKAAAGAPESRQQSKGSKEEAASEGDANAKTSPSASGCVIYADGSVLGRGDDHAAAAIAFGKLLASNGKAVLCDGRRCGGIVGALLRGATEAGSKWIKVMEKDVESQGVGIPSETLVVSPGAISSRLLEIGEWFVALSGGFRCWGEIFEVLSLCQLQQKELKPMGLLSVKGYYKPLLRQLERCVDSGFLQKEYLTYIVCGETPEELFEKLGQYSPTEVTKMRDERPSQL